MGQDNIDSAIEMATTGDPGEATRMLWPEMIDSDTRVEALFALAFCFEKAENYATANYLYEELAFRNPGFTEGVERQQACRKIVEERGLIEDFQDIGHRDCQSCTLRYRSEYLMCPFCGTYADKQNKFRTQQVKEKDEEQDLPGWNDPSILETIEDIGRDAADKIQDIVESDMVQDISSKVVSASLATGRKAKELASHEKVKEVTDRGADLGKEIAGKAEKITDSPALRDMAKKIEDASWTASDKMKDMLSPENKKKAADKAQRVGKSLLKKVRNVIDPPKKEDD